MVWPKEAGGLIVKVEAQESKKGATERMIQLENSGLKPTSPEDDHRELIVAKSKLCV